MDNNTLASNIIDSLAWPVTAIVILAFFRRELSSLFGRVRKGQFGDASVEFEAAVAVVEGMAQEKRGARKSAHAPARTEDRGLAEADPRAAVIKAWLEVESQARAALQRKGLFEAGDTGAPALEALHELAGLAHGLGGQDLLVYRELQVIRNKSARDRDFRPSPESVLGYMALAKELGEKFRAIE